MQERGHSGLPSALLSPKEMVPCPGMLGGSRVCSGSGGASILACPSLPGDVCSVAAVASLPCPDQPHTELQGCWELPEFLALPLSPGSLSFSLQISAKLVG